MIIGLVACAGERRPAESVATRPPAPSGQPTRPASLSGDIPPEIAPNRPRPATRVLVYPWVSPQARGDQTITTVDDLVIEERPGERRYDFDGAVDVATDAAGRMYVHDSGRYRVVAYEPDGSFARQYGSLDDAPFHLGWIAWTGERLAMSTGTDVTVFAPDGEHLFDRSLLRYAFNRDLRGTTDGSLVGSFYALDQASRSWYSVEKRSLDDDDAVLVYWAVRVPARGSSSPPARPGYAATPAGDVYVTRGDEYAVQAFAADGTARWILYVEPPGGPGGAPERLATSGSGAAASGGGAGSGEAAGSGATARAGATVGAGATAEPGPPALSVAAGRSSPGVGNPLRVDGRGNLYVFPYVAAPDEHGRVPVDVYSPAGERLFAGWIEQRSWLDARGDLVYGIEGADGAQRIVRYRLRAAFLSDAPSAGSP